VEHKSKTSLGEKKLRTLGASLMMIRFNIKGGCEGRTPSSIFLKYEAYRRWEGIVRSSGWICLHLAMYASASLTSPNPAKKKAVKVERWERHGKRV
jgi:hypothetical protein